MHVLALPETYGDEALLFSRNEHEQIQASYGFLTTIPIYHARTTQARASEVIATGAWKPLQLVALLLL
jgi:hypothetical protein